MLLKQIGLIAVCCLLMGCHISGHGAGEASVGEVAHGFAKLRSLPGCFGRVVTTTQAVAEQSLTAVNLAHHGIDDTCLVSLHDWFVGQKQIDSLDLSGNNISDEGLVNLLLDLDSHKLVTLSLRHNRVSEVSMSALGGYLATHATVANLDVSDNALQDRGACILTQSLASRGTLSSLGMQRVAMGGEGLQCVLGLMLSHKMPLHLDLEGNHFVAVEDLLRFHQVDTTLRSLRLASCGLDDETSASMAALLPYLKGLRQLDLSDNAMSDTAVVAWVDGVLSHKHLESLNMAFSVLTDVSEQSLMRLSEQRIGVDIQY